MTVVWCLDEIWCGGERKPGTKLENPASGRQCFSGAQGREKAVGTTRVGGQVASPSHSALKDLL